MKTLTILIALTTALLLVNECKLRYKTSMLLDQFVRNILNDPFFFTLSKPDQHKVVYTMNKLFGQRPRAKIFLRF